METCNKCNGTGKLPEYPRCVMTPNIIWGIRENAPKCDECKGKGYKDGEYI